MIKPIATMALLAVLTGCAAWTPVKYAANKVCDTTPERQVVLAAEFDKATHPNQIRVHCHAQEVDE